MWQYICCSTLDPRITSRGLADVERNGEGFLLLLCNGNAEAAMALNPPFVYVTLPAYKNHKTLLIDCLGGNNLEEHPKESELDQWI